MEHLRWLLLIRDENLPIQDYPECITNLEKFLEFPFAYYIMAQLFQSFKTDCTTVLLQTFPEQLPLRVILGDCFPFSGITEEPDENFVSSIAEAKLQGKSCSENIQQIYRRTSMPKCDFNKIATFQNNFVQEHLWRAASGIGNILNFLTFYK